MMHKTNDLNGDISIKLVSAYTECDGELYTVYGICVRTSTGDEFLFEDVSCVRDDVVALIENLRRNKFAFDELPYLIEDYIDKLAEYIPII